MLSMPIKGLSMAKRILRALLLAALMSGTAALAQAPANQGAITVADASGVVRLRIGDSDPQPLLKGQSVPIGARIVTGADSHVMLTFSDGQVVALGPQSRLLMRDFAYLPNDLAKSRVLFNLTDGSVHILMGAIGQRDPSLVQIQVGLKNIAQAPARARGNDVGVIVLGIATLVQVSQGRVSLLVASSNQSYGLAAGERALVQADGQVQMGSVRQVDDLAGRSADGKIMLNRMEALRRFAPPSARQIVVSLSTPPSEDLVDEFAAPGDIQPPVTPTVATGGTGGSSGGQPCAASCN
jgi:FecR protein